MVIIITALYWNFHNWCPTLADKITWPYTWFLTSMNSPQYDFISKKIGYLFWVNGNVVKLTFERWGKPPCCSLTWRRSPLVPCTINSNHDVLKSILRWNTFSLHYKEAHLRSVTCLFKSCQIRSWNLSSYIWRYLQAATGLAIFCPNVH